jgi:superfamily II DNA or RNA helicase
VSGLASLQLSTAYRKGRDDIAQDFYLPCMRVAERYDRAVGFFNSAIYVIAWPSLKDFVARHGRMRLICSPVLPAQDIEAIDSGYSKRFEDANAEKLRDDIRYVLASPYLHKPTTVLASLIALEVVDIRIAFMKRTVRHERLFHDKLGLFHDAFGNTLAFKGSMNETWSGLAADGNLESVDVFLSWEHAREASRVKEEEAYFTALWDNEYEHEGVTVRKFPEIARSELVNAADAKGWPDLVDDICRDIEAAERFEARTTQGARALRPHQSGALQAWEGQGRRGILEHATGSGKTFTAISAMRDALRRGEVPLVLVPSELLLDQWYEELTQNLSDGQLQILRCGAGHTKWREEGLIGPWTRPGSATPRLVLSTMQTAAMREFRSAIRQGHHIFLVADEVHRIGSPNHLQLLGLETGPRLGLSATPRRASDPEGTAKTFEYFNGVVPPPFSLQDAIKSGVLTQYFYHVHTVTLSSQEQERWDSITARIQRLFAQASSAKEANPLSEQQIKRLQIERGRVLKQARGKSSKAASVIRMHYHPGDRWIVYCDDLAQLGAVQAELTRAGLDSTPYHSSMTGDKEQTIRLFEGNGGILVSIRCLDEGVDIPSVSHALILASSKNPREYIQRRGRVLRRAEGKSVANIHDLLVLPSHVEAMEAREDPRLDIIRAEIARAIEFGRSALNPAAITDLERIALHFANDYRALVGTGYEEDE